MDERDYKAMNEELNQPSCLGDVSGSLHSTTLEKSKDDFMECDVVKCCKRGPITDEIYCPYCGKIIIRSNDR